MANVENYDAVVTLVKERQTGDLVHDCDIFNADALEIAQFCFESSFRKCSS